MIAPTAKSNLISIGNETFDKLLGGGLLNSSLNLFERQGPSSKILEVVWNKSLAATTLSSKNNLVCVNFNSEIELEHRPFISGLPAQRKVKSELLYKDVRGKSAAAKIKIAWRYSSRSSSPSDCVLRMNQCDFGLSIENQSADEDSLGILKLINIKNKTDLESFFAVMHREIGELKASGATVNIIIQDLLHPFSPLVDDTRALCKFLFILRCLARTIENGCILMSYDSNMCKDHIHIRHHLYNIADCVVVFHSYETGQNILSGYKNADGLIDYVKVPKINSLGPHFQRDLSDWGYRFTRNHRFFVVDELNLPVCDDDENEEERSRKQKASAIAKVENKLLKQVGPLEDFKEIASDILAKKL